MARGVPEIASRAASNETACRSVSRAKTRASADAARAMLDAAEQRAPARRRTVAIERVEREHRERTRCAADGSGRLVSMVKITDARARNDRRPRVADFAAAFTRPRQRPGVAAVRRDPLQSARRRAGEDDLAIDPDAAERRRRVRDRRRRAAGQRDLHQAAVGEVAEPSAIGRKKRRRAPRRRTGRRVRADRAAARRAADRCRFAPAHRRPTRRSGCRRARSRAPAPTCRRSFRARRSTVKRMLIAGSARAARVSCQIAAAAMHRAIAATPHGINSLPIDGDTRSAPARRSSPATAGGSGLGRRDRRDEAVAAPVQRLDVRRRLRVVAERLAQHADRLGQRRVGDERVLPDRVDQLLPVDDLAGALQQQLEHAEHARRQRDLRAVAAQQPAVRIEGERAERERRPALAGVGSRGRKRRTLDGTHAKVQC